jgi:hypothetical protein
MGATVLILLMFLNINKCIWLFGGDEDSESRKIGVPDERRQMSATG